MTWSQRQQLGLCCYPNCPCVPDDGNYCTPHAEDHRKRQRVSKRQRYWAGKRQLRGWHVVLGTSVCTRGCGSAAE